MSDDLLKAQVNALIRDEIQEVINEYVDAQDESSKTGLGFVKSDSFNIYCCENRILK